MNDDRHPREVGNWMIDETGDILVRPEMIKAGARAAFEAQGYLCEWDSLDQTVQQELRDEAVLIYRAMRRLE